MSLTIWSKWRVDVACAVRPLNNAAVDENSSKYVLVIR